jgi:dTDP-L-rhamnose 4-epimerase
VYGSGQSLVNPYAGILTHFFTSAARGQPPQVFEDGLPSRDFVHVDDAADATVRALDSDAQAVLNVGSGVRTTLLTVAIGICDAVAPDVRPVVVPQFRVGDIRHAFADIRRATTEIGYSPRVVLSAGLLDFIDWARAEPGRDMRFAIANEELARQGLLRSAGQS